MEFNFDTVRIGKKSYDFFKEHLLKENHKNIKEQIKNLILSDSIFSEDKSIDVVLVIPQKGVNIKIAILDNLNVRLNKKLKSCLPHLIYKGEEFKIYESLSNDIW